MSRNSSSAPTLIVPCKRRWLRYTVLAILVFPFLLSGLALVLPNLALRWGMEEALGFAGIESTIHQAEIDLGKGLIKIRGVQAGTPPSPMDLGSLDLRFRWKPLLNRQVSLERLALTGLNLTAEYSDKNKTLIISGVPLLPADPNSGESTTSPWGLDVSSIILTDSQLTLRHGPHMVAIEIDLLRLAGLNSRRPNQVSAWRFLGRVNGQSFDIHGNGTPLADIPTYALRVSGKEIDLTTFEAPLKSFGLERVRGLASFDLSISGDSQTLPQFGGNASLDNAEIATPQHQLAAERILWQGQVDALSTLRNEGSLHAYNLQIHSRLEPEQLSHLRAGEFLWTGQIQQDPKEENTATDSRTVPRAITVSGAVGTQALVVEHQENRLEAQAFSWQGEIHNAESLRIVGDLRSQGLKIHRQNQEQLIAARGGWSGQIHWNANPVLLIVDGETQLDEATLHSPFLNAASGRLHIRGRLQQDNELQFRGQTALHGVRLSRPDLNAAIDSLHLTIPQLTLHPDGNLESAAQLRSAALSLDLYGMRIGADEVNLAADNLNYTTGSDHIDWVGQLQAKKQSAKSGTLSLSQEQMDWNGAMTVYLTPKDRELQKGKGVYSGKGIHLQTGKFDVNIKESRTEGSFSRKIPRSATESPLALNLKTDTKDLWVRERKRDWLHTERITAKKLELRPGSGLFFQDVAITKPKFLARHLGKRGLAYPWRLEAESAQVSTMDITHKNGFRVDSITLNSALARITRGNLGGGELGVMGLEVFRPRKNSTQTTTPEKPKKSTKKNETDDEEPLLLTIGSLALDSNSRLEFVDQTTSNGIVRVALRELAATLRNISNADTEKPLSFQLDARVGSGHLKATGHTTPFLTPPDFDVRATLQSYNLISLSPYLADALGVHLHTGQMNASLLLTAMTGVLHGQVELNLRRLEMDALDPNAPLVKSANLPVESIVSWLKDSNGNISLTIPIDGDLYQPNFNFDQTISVAIGGAVRDTLAGTLRVVAFPLAMIVSFFENLGAEDLHLQTIAFAAGETGLTETANAQIRAVADSAKTKPNDPLIICSFSQADMDWGPLFAATQTKPMEVWLERALENRPVDATPLRAEVPDLGLLQTLADRRSLAVNSELLNSYGIEPDRRIACRSHVDDQGPRVEIGF